MALGEPRQVCPQCGHAITTSQGRHAPRCIRAACRYEGPGVPLDLDTRAREARSWVMACRRDVEKAQRELAAAEEVLAAISAQQDAQGRVYVPVTGQWWEPDADPAYYRAVEPCDEGCHHPVHALGHPERLHHLERAEWIQSAADRGVTQSGT